MRRIVLLGPQRLKPTLVEAVDALGVKGAVAAVTAGWQEREDEIDELSAHLKRPTVNLHLHRRGEDVFQRDPELFLAYGDLLDRTRKLQDLYRVRLGFEKDAVRALMAVVTDADLLDPEIGSAIDSLRELDQHHRERLGRLREAFDAEWRPHERPVVEEHRSGARHACSRAATRSRSRGGTCRSCSTGCGSSAWPSSSGEMPVFAWSAGAMVAGEQVVLFHDSPAPGRGQRRDPRRGARPLPRGPRPAPRPPPAQDRRPRARLPPGAALRPPALPRHGRLRPRRLRRRGEGDRAARPGAARGRDRRGGPRVVTLEDRGARAGPRAGRRHRGGVPRGEHLPDRRGRPRHVRLPRRRQRGEALARDLRPPHVPGVHAHAVDRPLVPGARPAARLAHGVQAPRRARRAPAADPRPAQPAGGPRPLRRQLGLLRQRPRGARVDPPRQGGAPGHARGARHREQGVRRPAPRHALPAGPHARDAALPAAHRPRRRRLPAVLRHEDGARQPDPPARDPADDRRLHASRPTA